MGGRIIICLEKREPNWLPLFWQYEMERQADTIDYWQRAPFINKLRDGRYMSIQKIQIVTRRNIFTSKRENTHMHRMKMDHLMTEAREALRNQSRNI